MDLTTLYKISYGKETSLEFIGHFGFKSGRMIDKFWVCPVCGVGKDKFEKQEVL